MSKPAVKKTVKLYEGKVTVEFNSLARNRYVILEDGHSPVGVTTILQLLSKEGLMTWPMYEAIDYLKAHPGKYEEAAKAYITKSDKGKSTGTDVHAFIEKFLGAYDDPKAQEALLVSISGLTPEAAGAVRLFVDWLMATEPKVLASEQIVYSKQYDYAGTYDALLEINGKTVLCDVKTNNSSKQAPLGIYPEMFLQLGAYSLAHHEENPMETIDDLMIIRVGKDGLLSSLSASALGLKVEFLEDTFKHLVQCYKMFTPLKIQLSEMGEK